MSLEILSAFSCFIPLYRVVRSVKDVIVNICEANDINLNSLEGGSLYIDVRRDFFMTDVIREGKKMKFDPKKKLSVSCDSKIR